jgi:hypothetical protein
MKQYEGSVIVIIGGVVSENIPFDDAKEGERIFIDKCEEHVSNWDEYNGSDIESVLDAGLAEFGRGSICLSWF